MSDLGLQRVGPTLGGSGTAAPFRADVTGAQVVTDAHGRYTEGSLRGNIFSASNQAGIALPVGLATAAKNFTLYNPVNSGKNLVLLEIMMGITLVPAAYTGVVGLVGNFVAGQAAPATATAETVNSSILGAASGAGKVYNTCTLAAAPVWLRSCFSVAWVTTGTGTTAACVKDEVAGAIVIPPGAYVSMAATAATTVQISMTWEEVPILA
jgi:hypothetical protein